jgi:hypothetical protein
MSEIRCLGCSRRTQIFDSSDAGQPRIHGIGLFSVLRGGVHLFMPSLSALRWIANPS